ncbi:MAG: alcohol dehydrogenase catalytic domain-containing protein [Fidelibacterota bacterium]|nr:MAG: alcohol dehydrogenase catalytic domain-containing protein [Candidatus Neomarinimicrobiota bacterium]
MKAMMLTGIRSMEMRETPQLEIEKDTDVLLKVAAVGVCGTDMHYYKEGRIGGQVVQYPFTIGHECSAVVEQVGGKVTRVKPGDLVTVDPTIACGKCDQCLIGRYNTCRDLLFLGCPGSMDGCLSEYIVMPEDCCFPARRQTSLEQIAYAEPLSIAVYAVKQSVPLENAKVGILGVGPIGLNVLLSAFDQGAAEVHVTDKLDYRLDVALSMGANWVGNPDKIDIVSEITAMQPLQLDVVFECCGDQEAVDQAVQLLKPGGQLIIVGSLKVERVSFDLDLLRWKELTVKKTRRQSGCTQAALDLLESEKINTDVLISHRFAFEQAKAAFDLVDRYADGVLKAMIIFQD